MKYCLEDTCRRNRQLKVFFAGESVPVNQKLSDIFLQLHISERSGRGVPKITELYGEDCIELRENSIVVTIPFERLETKVYAPVNDENVPDEIEIPPVGTEIPPVDTKIPPDRNENFMVKEPDMGGTHIKILCRGEKIYKKLWNILDIATKNCA